MAMGNDNLGVVDLTFWLKLKWLAENQPGPNGNCKMTVSASRNGSQLKPDEIFA
jgi:hypothetical protein